jgi:type IV secretory pathway VirJ component
MPLYANALDLIRANLELVKAGEKPRVVSIGYLTETQHQAINAIRTKEGKPLLAEPMVLFMGRHLYESRSAQGYTIDDMVAQVASAMSEQSIAEAHHKMTGIRNHTPRDDGYGKQVKDLGVFELYARRPKAELLSVIPKGDGR